MDSLEKKIRNATADRHSGMAGNVAPAMLAVTVVFLVAVLSIPVSEPQKLVWLAAYPILGAELTGVGFLRIFVKSLWIIPVVALVGMFNPILDTQTAFTVFGVGVSRGWVSFISIILRGLLSLQGVLLMVENTGFIDMFNAMRRLGCPQVLTTQMLLTYRYISVIMEEAIVMKRARAARGYGRKSYPPEMWARFVGQLLIVSVERAGNIHRAMKARGFNGTLPLGTPMRFTAANWRWLLGWSAFIAALRFIDFSSFFSHHFLQTTFS